ncbi:MAG: hypothetical protein NTV21_00945 [Planctomycetota bacterium]|nr:hypothetical protein [Planctomycetota bacterium]
MISKPKKVLYGAALVISSGLFANEVVNATQREQVPEPIERPAEAQLSGSEMPQAIAAAAVPQATTPVGGSSEVDAHEAPVQKDPLAALEAALSKLGASDATGAGEDGEETPRPRRKRPQKDETTEAQTTPAPETAPAPRISAAARAERRERIDELFEEEPLVGIVSGPSGTLALVGGRSVRVGDLLGDGETRVLECTSTGIRVEFEGEPAWIALPGLRAHVKPPQQNNEGGATAPLPPVARNAPQDAGNAGTAASSNAATSNQGGQP